MYCPRCGQQQVSDDVRFCSRCGFSLRVVTEVLAHNGAMPAASSSPAGRRCGPSRRRQQMRKGGSLLIGGILASLFLLFFTNMGGMPEGFAKLGITLAWVVAIVGLVRLVVAFLRDDDASLAGPSSQGLHAMAAQLSADPRGAALPPAQGSPVTDWRGRTQTSELVRPPSVTENTTKLLDEDQTGRQRD